jgi:plastocyanin
VSQPLRSRSPRSLRTAGLLAAAFLALGLLTACSGDDPAEDASGTTTESGADSGSGSGDAEAIAVSAVDFSFELDEDSFAPGTYEVTLTNNGESTHDVVVERDGEDVAQSEQINPGETSTFEVTLEEGDYVFYCSVGNHRQMGMEVPVTVTS